jgi:hypothetical protein
VAERCRHCGREGTLIRVEDVVFDTQPVEIIHVSGAGEWPREATEQHVLNIRRCSACGQPTVASYFWVDEWSDPEDEPRGWRLLYPPERDPAMLPPGVRDRYLEMLELQYAPDAFAVRAGKLLEAVCADQGVPRIQDGKDLSLGRRLDQLVSNGKLPQPLVAQARLVKDFRNIGGHDDDIALAPEDVHLVREFAEALLGYLFWGPASLERSRQALQDRIDASRDHAS